MLRSLGVGSIPFTSNPALSRPSPPFDFIDVYAQYADLLEAPRDMHEMVATQILAALLNRNGVIIPHGTLAIPLDLWIALATQILAALLNRNGVIIPHGTLAIPLDLWIALLSGSGQGRSTLVGLAQPVLEAAGVDGLILNTQWGSPQALYQEMAENPAGLFVWGELAEKFKLLADPRFHGAKQWITDRYDNLATPDAVKYRTTGKKQDTPPIEFLRSPRINILATSSEDWFFNNLSEDDSKGGFIPRWLLLRPSSPRRVVPVPAKADERLIKPLAEHLKKVADLRGKADTTHVLDADDQWYREAQKRFDGQPNLSLAQPYFNRHRMHILKLAVIDQVAQDPPSLIVSMESWGRAVKVARRLERTILDLLGTGMSGAGFALKRVEDRIRQAGPEGLSRSVLTRAFQHDTPRDREERLRTLLDGRVVFTMTRGTAGRSAQLLVHDDHLGEYTRRHPEDRPA